MAPIYPWQPKAVHEYLTIPLGRGDCVGVPTESTYEIVASALHLKDSASIEVFASDGLPPTLVLWDYANLFDWMPLMRGAGSRIFRKHGAGPITLSADGGFSHGLWNRLSPAVRQALVRDGKIAVRWPTHPIWDELRHLDFPLLSVAVPGATTAAELVRLTGDRVGCVLDAGPTLSGGVPTVVQADGQRCRVLREGAVPREHVEEFGLCRILFICTGNTCRSPMAEVLCAKMLADQLGCAPGELRQHGFQVQSAGLHATMGSEASPDSVRVAADFGADLSQHRSRTASLEMLQWADHVFCMTASHAYALMSVADLPPPRLVSPQGDDVADPIGGEMSDYRTCAEQIIQCLQQRLPELLES